MGSASPLDDIGYADGAATSLATRAVHNRLEMHTAHTLALEIRLRRLHAVVTTHGEAEPPYYQA